MSNLAAMQRALHESNKSRRRAWRALQGIREVLAKVSDEPLPPPQKPLCFATEGETLRMALLDFLRDLSVKIEQADKAVTRMRSHLGGKGEPGRYPHDLVDLNRAMARLVDINSAALYTLQKLNEQRR